MDDITMDHFYDHRSHHLSEQDPEEAGTRDPRLTLASEVHSFRDCLASTVECKESTTFWRRLDDVLLKPLTEMGHEGNARRKELKAMVRLKRRWASERGRALLQRTRFTLKMYI